MNRNTVFLVAGIAGLALGFILSGSTQQDTTYCDNIQQQLQQNRSFNGSIACYPPGVLDVNVSERVDDNTDLKCVCRIIDRSGIKLFPIAVSN